MQKCKLSRLVDEMLAILDEADSVIWRASFRMHREQLVHADEEEIKSCARTILRLASGGMGSFNDLVLSRNGRVEPELNERLDRARHKLYSEATKILS